MLPYKLSVQGSPEYCLTSQLRSRPLRSNGQSGTDTYRINPPKAFIVNGRKTSFLFKKFTTIEADLFTFSKPKKRSLIEIIPDSPSFFVFTSYKCSKAESCCGNAAAPAANRERCLQKSLRFIPLHDKRRRSQFLFRGP